MPTIKKQVHPVEDFGISPWPVDVVEFSADATPTGSRLMSNNYITRCQRRLELVGVRGRQSLVRVAVSVRASVAVGDKMPLWEPAPERGLGPSGPGLSSPAEWGRSAAMVRGTWGQYVVVCSVSNSPLTHNQHQPFCNPFGRYIFLKKCVRSSLLLIMFPDVYVYV